MDRVPLDSSSLAAVAYDSATETLEVEFEDGTVYRYFDVPTQVYDEFVSAESHGRFFNLNIRSGGYRHERLDDTG